MQPKTKILCSCWVVAMKLQVNQTLLTTKFYITAGIINVIMILHYYLFEALPWSAIILEQVALQLVTQVSLPFFAYILSIIENQLVQS